MNDLSKNQLQENVVHKELSSFVSPLNLNNRNIPGKVQYQSQSGSRDNAESTQPFVAVQLTETQSIDEIATYKCWSILNILCCCWCLGCIAFHYSRTTKKLKQQHNIRGASETSKQARNLNICGTIIGTIMIICVVVYHFLINPQPGL
jgi:hypothetical protein